MYLNDVQIKLLAEEQEMITPYFDELLNPCTYDLTLSAEFLREADHGPKVDPLSKENIYKKDYIMSVEDFYIQPGEFMLASTNETIHLPSNLAAQVLGKSSIGRLGLFIHNAGHIDPGFHGKITLELFNASSKAIRLNDIVRICQIAFIPLTNEAEIGYNGRYQGQNAVTGSRLHITDPADMIIMDTSRADPDLGSFKLDPAVLTVEDYQFLQHYIGEILAKEKEANSTNYSKLRSIYIRIFEIIRDYETSEEFEL